MIDYIYYQEGLLRIPTHKLAKLAANHKAAQEHGDYRPLSVPAFREHYQDFMGDIEYLISYVQDHIDFAEVSLITEINMGAVDVYEDAESAWYDPESIDWVG